MKRPLLFAQGIEKFWDDEHISKEILRAHLHTNTDAANRPPEYIDMSVDWLQTVLPEGAKLFDIGCEPDLYTSRLSKRGMM